MMKLLFIVFSFLKILEIASSFLKFVVPKTQAKSSLRFYFCGFIIVLSILSFSKK